MNPEHRIDDLAQRVSHIEGFLYERAMRDSVVEMFRAIRAGQVTMNDRLDEIEKRLSRIEEAVAGHTG